MAIGQSNSGCGVYKAEREQHTGLHAERKDSRQNLGDNAGREQEDGPVETKRYVVSKYDSEVDHAVFSGLRKKISN